MTSGPNVALSFRDIGKVYRGGAVETRALDGLSLDIHATRFTAIVGPSGCGKSTLLHIAAGLDTQFSGTLRQPAELTAHTACVFQTPRLLPWLSAQRNVEFVLDTGRNGNGRDAARRVLQLVGLEGFEDRFPSQLSGGMQQRVSLARALAIEPSMLLMDEPFSALDELTARDLRVELLRLNAAAPRTVVFVTHNVTEAAFLADRVVVLSPRPGRIVADIAVEIPYPRDYESPAVAAMAKQIVRHLELR